MIGLIIIGTVGIAYTVIGGIHYAKQDKLHKKQRFISKYEQYDREWPT